MKKEESCSSDGEPCSWVDEKEYTPEGNLLVNTYCKKCFKEKYG